MPLVGACITCFIFGSPGIPSSRASRCACPIRWEPGNRSSGRRCWPSSSRCSCCARQTRRRSIAQPGRVSHRRGASARAARHHSDSDVAAGIIDVLTQASFAVMALAIWCSMASAVRSVPFAATFVFPACLALLALAFVAGLCGSSPSSAPTAARSVSSCSPCTWRSSPYRSRKARGSAKAGAPSLTARTTRARTSTAAATRWQPNGGCRRAEREVIVLPGTRLQSRLCGREALHLREHHAHPRAPHLREARHQLARGATRHDRRRNAERLKVGK